MKAIFWFFCVMLMFRVPVHTQSAIAAHQALPAHPVVAVLSESDDDPGYAVYKKGYNHILSEQWDQARKEFSDLMSRFPQSEYLDDAAYWNAYALRHKDRKKSIDEYRSFISRFPHSRYYDDAVADLSQLESRIMVLAPEGTTMAIGKDGESFSYGFATTPTTPTTPRPPRGVASLERQMQKYSRQFRRMGKGFSAPFLAGEADQKLDPETKLRVEAVYALGSAREDQQAFSSLKEIAIDKKQHRKLRVAALDALTDFKKFDAMPVFLDVARTDTSSDLQATAVDCISAFEKDKNKSVGVLIDLFHSIPSHRKEQTETIFYTIAEVGNDKAVDFLTTVAMNHENYDLRTDAVFYLGNIGGEKARSSLRKLLKGK